MTADEEYGVAQLAYCPQHKNEKFDAKKWYEGQKAKVEGRYREWEHQQRQLERLARQQAGTGKTKVKLYHIVHNWLCCASYAVATINAYIISTLIYLSIV